VKLKTFRILRFLEKYYHLATLKEALCVRLPQA